MPRKMPVSIAEDRYIGRRITIPRNTMRRRKSTMNQVTSEGDGLNGMWRGKWSFCMVLLCGWVR